MSSSWIPLQIAVLGFLLGLLGIMVSNWRVLKRLADYPPPEGDHGTPWRWPRVSVLVPARNEENNIGPCVRSLLAQDYPDLEILVLDDHSTDQTGQILAELALTDPRLRVLQGKPLPSDWLGKHWACQQLAEAAASDLLLFTDADTRHGPLMLRHGVSGLYAERADMLTALTRQEVISWGERLTIPLLQYGVLGFLPLGLAYRLRMPFLSSANGQFMLFRREALELIGGFASVRHDAVDDIAMGRRIRACGLNWRLCDAVEDVSCRMYRSFGEAYTGLTKSLFAASGYHFLSYVLVWAWLLLVFWEPLVVLAVGALGGSVPDLAVALAAASMLCSLVGWGLTYHRFRIPLYLTLVYPISIILCSGLAMCSMFLTVSGRATWKGRPLVRARVHWL